MKDKTQLLEYRKKIEIEMERFKVVEKETKTKAFSKEGLAAAANKKDPKEKAKDDAKEWINNAMETLNEQIEVFESEIESLTSSKKKGKNAPGGRLGQLEESMSRHHQHIARLELCVRLVDDDALEPTDAEDLKDLVEDYLERNQDDFDEFAEVEDMYADLDLDELENVANRNKANSVNIAAELALAAAKADKSAKSGDTTDDTSSKTQTQLTNKRTPEKAIPAPVSKGGVLGGGAGLPAPLGLKHQEDSQLGGKAIPGPKKEGREGTLGGNGGSWGAPGGAEGLQQQQSWSFPPGSAPDSQQQFPGSPQQLQGSSKFPLPMQQQRQAAAQHVPGSPQPAQGSSPGGKGLPTPLQFPKSLAQDGKGGDKQSSGSSESGDDAFALPAALAELLEETTSQTYARFGEGLSSSGDKSNSDEGDKNSMDATPGVLLGGVNHHDPAVNLRLLEASHRNLPRAGDGQWTRKRTDRSTNAEPSSYPTTLPPVLDNHALFERLDADALFFTFYYQQGSSRQYLAARELKRANWRFHKKHAMWFARQEEPKTSTEEYEQGSYIYFDFGMTMDANGQMNGWCQRSKSDFVFQYSQLESELV